MPLIAAHLNAGHSGGDSVAIDIYSPSSPTSIPLPPFPPSLINLMVSVDVKHHVTYFLSCRCHGCDLALDQLNLWDGTRCEGSLSFSMVGTSFANLHNDAQDYWSKRASLSVWISERTSACVKRTDDCLCEARKPFSPCEANRWVSVCEANRRVSVCEANKWLCVI